YYRATPPGLPRLILQSAQSREFGQSEHDKEQLDVRTNYERRNPTRGRARASLRVLKPARPVPLGVRPDDTRKVRLADYPSASGRYPARWLLGVPIPSLDSNLIPK